MSAPKIVFSDIDGTLLNAERVLSNFTISEFERIKTEVPIILISARMPKAISHLQQMASISHFPKIAYNGGLIIVENEIVFSAEISNQVLQNLISYNNDKKIHFSLYNNDDWYVPQMDYWAKREQNNTKVVPTVLSNESVHTLWDKKNKGAHKIMCMGNVVDIDNLSEFLLEKYGAQLHVYRSKSTYIEISPKVISKKTAISYVLEKLYPTLKASDAVAFGDNYNDIEMIQHVGWGVAVANARAEVLESANFQTDSHLQDGVAKFIKKHIK